MSYMLLLLVLSSAWAGTPDAKLYQGCLERIAHAHTVGPERLREILAHDAAAAICLKNVPDRFKTHSDFHRLAYDPDRKLISAQTIREAMAAIEAVQLGLVAGPVTRAPAGSSADFYDGHGGPFDVKCYSSPGGAKVLPVDPVQLTRWISEKLARDAQMRVLLDRTYLTDQDYAALNRQLKSALSGDEQARILELLLPEPILRLQPKEP